MLNRLIRFSLQNRFVVIAAAAMLLVYGTFAFLRLPVDVLPDLNRPRVTIFLEANGMAPEEVESQVVLPVETALNGSVGVESVRSNASIGIGMVFVEFDWNTDIYLARQLVAEKLQTVKLPDGVTPVMGPISSVMGQIMLIGVTADTTDAMTLRTLAEFDIRRRLMSIEGVSQVIPIGGERMQYQVLVSPQKLSQFNISVDEVDRALQLSGQNTTGGFFDRYGSEVLIRTVARAETLGDLRNTVLKNQDGEIVLLSDVAEITYGAGIKRGDASINGKPAVILTIEKQPGANTVELTEKIELALNELQATLPKDVKLNPGLFQQKQFISNSLENVEHALRDGFILVVIVLVLFLLNFRTTIITLTAIPLSLVVTAVIFHFFGISINTLTLGGLAIAIGELVDDAIVDVENVFRRLRENRTSPDPKPILQVVYSASSEVRNSIVYATIIVILVFIPLFYMQGMEGKIFIPLGIAYVTSIAASLLVSLTVTPALCSLLLKKIKKKHAESDSWLVRLLKQQDTKLLHWGLKRPKLIIGTAVGLIALAVSVIPFFGTEFLPAFNEGSFTINLSAPPGTSLEESNRIGTTAEQLLLEVPEVDFVSRRTGRAELDEHVEPVSNSEIEVELSDSATRTRDEILADIRTKLAALTGVSVNIGQPISHRLDHLLSGVRAQVAIKLYGEDLDVLRTTAGDIQATLQTIPGVVDIQVEKQVMVPELLVKIDREALKLHGLQAGAVAEDLEIFHNGKTTGQIIDGQKSFDVVLRATNKDRNNIESILNTSIETGNGTFISLHEIATIDTTYTPNTISHEKMQRRIVISCNVQDRDLGTTVNEIRERISSDIKLQEGYYIDYDGQFETSESASQLLVLLGIFAVAGIFIVLLSHFKSWEIATQIMLNIPLALVGSVAAIWLTGGTFSVATLVGFITLTGIASRNGIMMISHYIHLVEHEGETFGKSLIIRGSLERLVPVLMTALVAALALIPLTLDPLAPGKEILYPVAVVILGGLISSTLLDMIVTPVVFYSFGEKALKKYMAHKQPVDLINKQD